MSKKTNEADTKFVHINDITNFALILLVSLFTRVFVHDQSGDNQLENTMAT